MTSRGTRLPIALALMIAATAITGCTAVSREDSCGEFGAALSTSSGSAVNAFARLDGNPVAAISELRVIRADFDASAVAWSSEVHAAATEFSTALYELTAATEAATKDGAIDAESVHAAVAKYQARIQSLGDVCQPSPVPTGS